MEFEHTGVPKEKEEPETKHANQRLQKERQRWYVEEAKTHR